MSSSLFHLIEDATVIIRTKRGVYRQSTVYRRGERVFAKHGGGFIRLMAHEGTSCADVLWSDLDATGVEQPRIGAPRVVAVAAAQAA